MEKRSSVRDDGKCNRGPKHELLCLRKHTGLFPGSGGGRSPAAPACRVGLIPPLVSAGCTPYRRGGVRGLEWHAGQQALLQQLQLRLAEEGQAVSCRRRQRCSGAPSSRLELPPRRRLRAHTLCRAACLLAAPAPGAAADAARRHRRGCRCCCCQPLGGHVSPASAAGAAVSGVRLPLPLAAGAWAGRHLIAWRGRRPLVAVGLRGPDRLQSGQQLRHGLQQQKCRAAMCRVGAG